MKTMKKLLALLLALTLVFGLAATGYAAGETSGDADHQYGTITIQDPVDDIVYNAYRLLDLVSWKDDDPDPSSGDEQDELNTDGNYAYKLNAMWDEFFGYTTTDFPMDNDPTPVANAPGSKYVTVDKQGYVTWNATETDYQAFAQAALLWAKGDGESNVAHADAKIVATNTATTENKEKNGTLILNRTTDEPQNMRPVVTDTDVPLGWYLVDTSLGSLCSLGTTDNTAEIWEKSETTEHKKEVFEDQTPGGENTVDVGDKVEYRATIEIQTGAQAFTFHDQMDEVLELLTEAPNDIKVYLAEKNSTGDDWNYTGKTPVAQQETVDTETVTNYTIATIKDDDQTDDLHKALVHTVDSDKNLPFPARPSDGETTTCTFHVNFTQEFLTKNAGKAIVIEYKAEVLETAKKIIANENRSILEYGDGQYTPRRDTKTYTYPLYIWKFEDTNGGTADNGGLASLAGADFVLYKEVKNSEDTVTGYDYLIAENKGNSGTWVPVNEDDTDEKLGTQWFNSTTKLEGFDAFYSARNNDGTLTQNANFKGTIMTSDTDGYIKIEGLDAGTYYLKETHAPDGYNPLFGEIKITINKTANDTVEIKYQMADKDGKFAGTDATASVKYTLDEDGKYTANVEENNVIPVLNSTGREMPRTGGMGTTLFYVLGSIMVIGAAVILISKKRVNG